MYKYEHSDHILNPLLTCVHLGPVLNTLDSKEDSTLIVC